MLKFLKIWAHFLGAHTDSTVWKYVWVHNNANSPTSSGCHHPPVKTVTFFTCIYQTYQWVMIVNTVFFASQIEIWETAFHDCNHIYPIDKDMPLTFWLVWLSLFLFLWLFFPLKFSFLWVTITFLSQKSVASGVYTTFPQITQKILITDTCHWLEPITVILDFWKYLLLEKPSLFSELQFFLKVQGYNFQVQYWMDCVFPLVSITSSCKNCIDCVDCIDHV